MCDLITAQLITLRHGGTHNNSFCEFSTFLFSFLHMHIFWWNICFFFSDALSTKPVFHTLKCEREREPSWNSSMKPHKEFFLAFYLLAIVLCYFVAKLFTWDIHTVDYRLTTISLFSTTIMMMMIFEVLYVNSHYNK